jgi:hypothetical protein
VRCASARRRRRPARAPPCRDRRLTETSMMAGVAARPRKPLPTRRRAAGRAQHPTKRTALALASCFYSPPAGTCRRSPRLETPPRHGRLRARILVAAPGPGVVSHGARGAGDPVLARAPSRTALATGAGSSWRRQQVPPRGRGALADSRGSARGRRRDDDRVRPTGGQDAEDPVVLRCCHASAGLGWARERLEAPH